MSVSQPAWTNQRVAVVIAVSVAVTATIVVAITLIFTRGTVVGSGKFDHYNADQVLDQFKKSGLVVEGVTDRKNAQFFGTSAKDVKGFSPGTYPFAEWYVATFTSQEQMDAFRQGLGTGGLFSPRITINGNA